LRLLALEGGAPGFRIAFRRGERRAHVEAHLAGVPEYALAIVGEVLVQTQPRKVPTQQARERRLARLQRLAPQVLAIAESVL
jgi:hypothetical protein